MTKNESEQRFHKALRVALRRIRPQELTIDELVLQMRCLGFASASKKTIEQQLASLSDTDMRATLARLLRGT